MLITNRKDRQKKMNKCCEDLGNMFFQYLNQENNKVYECSECEKHYAIIIKDNKVEYVNN